MKPLKIMAVDDERHVLALILDSLQDYEVTTETAPLRALEMVKTGEYDIFIVDYQMPVVNGIEFFEELQEYSKNRSYVNIFCTAHGTAYIFKHEFQEGLFQIFLEKPFTGKSVQKAVAEAIAILEKKRRGETE